jgi:hypothetical protein
MAQSVEVVRLGWHDETLAALALPNGTMTITRGIGSGLSMRAGEPTLWAIGDRGPNLKVRSLAERYGVDAAAAHAATEGAKVMPRPDIGPALIELRVGADAVEQVRTLPIADHDGAPISGLPTPDGPHANVEPAIDLAGTPLGSDPSGADTEGLVALADGGFWVGDEYGPSLLRLDADGRVLVRWVPAGTEAQFRGARYPVEGRLPAIAARRRINRGFEALGLSPDGARLHLAFQSPLAHPDDDAHEGAAHVRVWTIDATDGTLLAHYAYPLDPPERFRRDRAEGGFERSDVKLSELIVLDDGRLLCLERGSASTKLYLVRLDPDCALPRDHLLPETRPTLEELSARDELADHLPVLGKTLLIDTDDHPEIGRDLEGMALLAADTLLLVSDNDFGVEGAETGFWRVRFPAAI